MARWTDKAEEDSRRYDREVREGAKRYDEEVDRWWRLENKKKRDTEEDD